MKNLFKKIFGKKNVDNSLSNEDSLSTQAQYSDVHDADVSTVANFSTDTVPKVIQTQQKTQEIPENISFKSREQQKLEKETLKERHESSPFFIPGISDSISVSSDISDVTIPNQQKPAPNAISNAHKEQMDFREREQKRNDERIERTGRFEI